MLIGSIGTGGTGPVSSEALLVLITCANAEEVLVVIKTTQARYEAIERFIQKQTSYELPEILAVPVHSGSSEYLKWLTASVSSEE